MSKRAAQPSDLKYMKRALLLAEKARGQTSPNPMVGAVIVQGGTIVGEGYHERAGLPHAEINALREAGDRARGSTLYVTLEPCAHRGKTPPCVNAIIAAGIKRVVVASKDPNPLVNGKGLRYLKEAGIEVESGILEREALTINEFFMTYHRLKRPFIILKWSMSLDGRTSTDRGDSRWISNEISRRYVHEIRSRVDAVLVGIQTVIADNPHLTVRLPAYRGRQPIRIILDYYLRIPPRMDCLDQRKGVATWIFCHTSASKRKSIMFGSRGIRVFMVAGRSGKLDLTSVLRIMHEEKIQSVMVEGGRKTAGAFIDGGVVDKIIAFISPRLVGGVKPTFPTLCKGATTMQCSLNLDSVEIKCFGDDVCIEGYLKG